MRKVTISILLVVAIVLGYIALTTDSSYRYWLFFAAVISAISSILVMLFWHELPDLITVRVYVGYNSELHGRAYYRRSTRQLIQYGTGYGHIDGSANVSTIGGGYNGNSVWLQAVNHKFEVKATIYWDGKALHVVGIQN